MKTKTTKKQNIAAQRIIVAKAELARWATKLSVNLSGGNWYSDDDVSNGNNLQRDFYDGETQYHFICYFHNNSADADGSELEKNC